VTASLFAGFVAALVIETAGLALFLVLYLRDSSWHDTAVGRHLAYYTAAFLAAYLLTLTSLFIRQTWLVVAILVSHLGLIAVIWQRVWLVWRATRR